MTSSTDTELYVPDPPVNLQAQPSDIAALDEFVKRFGWHEFMWHVGQLLVKAHSEASGTKKQGNRSPGRQ